MPYKIVDLKGSVLTVTKLQLFSANVEECIQALDEKVAPAKDFFKGASVIIEPKQDPEDPMFLAMIVEHLHQLGMMPIGVRSDHPVIQEQAQFTGLGVFSGELEEAGRSKKSESVPEMVEIAPEPEKESFATAMVINRPIRSGQQIYAKNRDLVIMGAVNPGAEVIADGNVTVFGRVLGKVIAGHFGNFEAQIFAKELNPELICIAGLYQLSGDIDESHKQGWVCVRLNEQVIEIKPI